MRLFARVAARPAAARPVAGEDSSLLRADLEGELAWLRSSEEALTWAQRVLPTKNTSPMRTLVCSTLLLSRSVCSRCTRKSGAQRR